MRRGLLAGAVGAGAALVAGGARAGAKEKEADIPPTEDLMREHGVLRRILIVYEEAGRRSGTDAAAVGVIAAAARIIQHFVEGYHEKLEEQFVLPKLEKAGELVELAKVIRIQHAKGRTLTQAILSMTAPGKPPAPAQQQRLLADMQSFSRMYAAHAAREDTEIFPAYRRQFTEAQLDELGDRFEEQEHKLLGAGGFEGSLREVEALERALGIGDLAVFTPA